MWDTDTLWFDVAFVMTIFAIGNILFGHFEDHRPKGWRLLKIALVLPVFVGTSVIFGRAWAFGLSAIPVLAVLMIHAWWLPKHGINGWTGEPKAKYYELIGYKKGEPGGDAV